MKLSDLILAVGDDNVKLQNLFDSMGDARQVKDGSTKISFYTDGVTCTELMDTNKSRNVGLVIWLPREKLEAAVAAAKAAAPEMTYEQALKIVDGLTLGDLKAIMEDPSTDAARLAELDQACGVFNRHVEAGKRTTKATKQ